jgi:hypothetical protein
MDLTVSFQSMSFTWKAVLIKSQLSFSSMPGRERRAKTQITLFQNHIWAMNQTRTKRAMLENFDPISSELPLSFLMMDLILQKDRQVRPET